MFDLMSRMKMAASRNVQIPDYPGEAATREVVREGMAEIERLRAALIATRKLVSEAAMTGFNCHDGDWAERLFVNQANITAALEQKADKS